MEPNSPTLYVGQSPVPRPWPEAESKIGCADMWLALLVSAVFVPLGVALCVVATCAKLPGLGRNMLLVMGISFFVFGCLILTIYVLNRYRGQVFRHAADHVLPNVPREPAIQEGQTSFGMLTHDFEETDHGYRLFPKPNLLQSRTRFFYGWMIFISVIASLLFWYLPDIAPDFPRKIFLICLVTMISLTVAGIFEHVYQLAAKELLNVDFNEQHDICKIGGTKENARFPLSSVIAVQICSARRKIGRHNNCNYFSAFELNLVWNEPEDAHRFQVRRRTILNQLNATREFLSLAVHLANSLNIPLLNHATPHDWEMESQRQKSRPYENSGGYMG